MEKRTVANITKHDCTGCASCANCCPVNAISMIPNDEGFLYPNIDASLCINCGMCISKCPVEGPEYENFSEPKVFASCAQDDIRMSSSSGGLFTLLAEYVLEKNGKVCGAVYDEDFRGVHHVLIDKKEELELLRGSKYLQSRIEDVYQRIKEALDEGSFVLFAGCGCQVAGLKKYLGNNYDKLYTIDLVCHGVPSPKAFNKFLDSEVLREFPNETIVDFSFRKKSEWGWAHSTYAKFSNGYVYSKAKTQNSWYTSFLNLLNCRESCGHCQFNKFPRQGDFTLGDFWGINEMPENWNDGKGANIVCLNTSKAEIAFDEITDKLVKNQQIDLQTANKNNGNLSGSSRLHKERRRFFNLLDMYDDYGKVTEYSNNRKFDIGYVGWWYGKNYGSVMTNFALEQYLVSIGYSVLMLEWPEHVKNNDPLEDSFSRRFAAKYYEKSIRRTYDELPDLNWFCDTFVVGSDQLWNYWSTKENGSYFFLDFVDDSRKKIAYATSFGHSIYGAPRSELEKNSFHLSRFDYISVREKDGVDLCNDVFGVKADWAIEPVFLLEKEAYVKLAKDSKADIPKNYLFAYILTPTEEKRNAIQKLAEEMGLEIVLVLDAQADFEKNRNIMDMPSSLRENLEMEDWLRFIMDSRMVVTDSFHGLCFSIIFEKEFMCIGNAKRGLSRFKTLLEVAHLEDRMVMDAAKILEYDLSEQINYEAVKEQMKPIIDESKQWLIRALKAPKPFQYSTYDILLKRINELEKRLRELER